MVSLIEIIKVEQALLDSPKANGLYSYLQGKEIILPIGEVSKADSMYYTLLKALSKNNSSAFTIAYNELSERELLTDQPIIYDNYLIFLLLIGLKKFNLSDKWIKELLHLRNTPNEPERTITTSFQNLLNNNYLTTDGAPSIILVALIKISKNEINETIVRNSFKSNNNLSHLLGKDLFIASIYLFSQNYIISVSIGNEAIQLKGFKAIFLKRINLLANLFYGLIVLTIIVTWFYLIRQFPNIKDLANDLGILLQIIGFGLLAYLLNKIKSQLTRLFKLFFGYPDEKTNL